MPLATQAQPNPHLQPRFQRTETSHRQGSSPTFSLDASAAPEKIVYVVSDDATHISSLAAFLSAHSIKTNAVMSASDFIRDARPNQTATGAHITWAASP
jgi:hypothetical protein